VFNILHGIQEEKEVDYDLEEGKVVFDDHDADDTDFVKLIKKHGLKAKSDGDDTTVTGSPDKIEKVLQTIYGNDWKDMYTRKGQNFENFAGKEVVAETNKNDKSDDGDGMDAVQPKAVKKKFASRKDKDIDNDGDVDSSDKYLHKRRKAVSKAITKKEGNAFGKALKDAKDKGEKTFVVSGKTYKVEDYKKENYEFGTPERTKHTLEVTPGQSQEDWDETVGVMHKKNDTMREALAKMWSVDEGHNPFIKEADEFKPHMMYDPKTGKGFKANTMADHLRMKDMGYTHDAPKKENKTMTGKPTTKVTIEPEMKD
jgi:hypothetical protein